MTKRQQSLLRWLDDWGPFETEHALKQTAARAMSANDDEADWLARQWRERIDAELVEQMEFGKSAPLVTAGGPIGAGGAEQPDKQEEPTMTDQEVPTTEEVQLGAVNRAMVKAYEREQQKAAIDNPSIRATEVEAFDLDNRRAQAYAASGYWPDAVSLAKALVKIEAGRSLGLPAIVAMNEIHVIEGKPEIGAGALAALVKASGRYDFRVIELTNELCRLRFYDQGEAVGESVFTAEDAERADLMKRKTYQQYPRNMLFSRAMTNGVGWFAPDVTGGKFYGIGEIPRPDNGEEQPIDAEAEEVPLEA